MINNHTDLQNPFWVVINPDDTLHYGEIKEGTQLSTKMPIVTFSNKQDWIAFIEANGGEYVEQELTE
jgi:ligand-binding SRPBCC domain-containing protein